MLSLFYMLLKKFIFPLLLFLCYASLQGQEYTQTIRGTITDKDSKIPIIGANVILLNNSPVVGTVSDVNGNFRISSVPVGRQDIRVTLLGYNTIEMPNILVTSAKEIVLEISLEEKVTAMDEVVVKAQVRKDRPINDMAIVSARSFTVEETEKYAGSRGDVARMASSYAGVSFANDQRNDIIIRGNSPMGLLWRMEDVDIPNPNHFAENGTTGGPVGMLNNNVLKNSDFFTGAFPAEYGNAFSGVFDLKMRNGNNEKHEYIFQCGFNGFELGGEGPFTSKHASSYLVNLRYSTLGVLDKMGVDFGTAGVPKYMDGTFKINVPFEKGQVTFFGIAGNSSIEMLSSRITDVKLYSRDDEDVYSKSGMAASGLSVNYFISKKTYVKCILSGLYESSSSQVDTLAVNRVPTRIADHNIDEYRTSISFILGTKYNSGLSSKAGITLDRMGYKLNTITFNDDSMRLIAILKDTKALNIGPTLLRSYFEASYKLTDNITINPGLQFMYFDLNSHKSLEPRFSISWMYAKNRKLNFGYGLHSRLHSLSTYYLGTYSLITVNMNGSPLLVPMYQETNKNLDFIRSHQFVIGHDWSIDRNLRLKVETYCQYLFDVPVESRSTYYSILNSGTEWGIGARDSLVNKGKGYNYGCEITFEKFLSKNYYFLITASLFESKYRGSDGVLRNTAFNGNYVFNFLSGYEYRINSSWSVAFDGKATCAGGKRYIPVLLKESVAANETKHDFNNAFKNKFSDFFKMDLKISFRFNGKSISQEWQLYMENITDHQNILDERFSRQDGQIVKTYQLGRFPGKFPMVTYRLNF
jgi:hypothetical protein